MDRLFLPLGKTGKENKVIPICVFIVMVLPVLLFISGWLKPIIAIPGILCILTALYFAYKNITEVWMPDMTRQNIVKLTAVLTLVFGWVYLSGIGGYVFQNLDHSCRNAIFEDMVSRSWPVIDSETGLTLVYYIGFWMVPALAGKMLGMMAGYVAQLLWASLLIFLMYLIICSFFRKVVVWPILLFIFFSGMDVVTYCLEGGVIGQDFYTLHIEWHDIFQLSSHTTQLFWVFNQAIPAWMVFMYIFTQKNVKSTGFLIALVMLNAPFPFVGMLPFAAYLTLYAYPRDNMATIKNVLDYFMYVSKNVFTVENVLGGGAVGLISYFYLSANISGGRIDFLSFAEVFQNKSIIYSLIFEVLIMCAVIRFCGVKSWLLYLSAIVLVGCIFIKVGYSYDFAMRTTIPALNILFLLTCAALKRTYVKRKIVPYIFMILVVILGIVTPSNEIMRTIRSTVENAEKNVENYIPPFDLYGGRGVNFVAPVNDSFYGRYLMKVGVDTEKHD